MYYGQVPLNHALLAQTLSLSASNVMPLLRKDFEFRAQNFDGSVVDPETLKASGAIQVQIASRTVRQTPHLDQFPEYGAWAVEETATLGQNGYSVLG
jgi:hypothetical protein